VILFSTIAAAQQPPPYRLQNQKRKRRERKGLCDFSDSMLQGKTQSMGQGYVSTDNHINVRKNRLPHESRSRGKKKKDATNVKTRRYIFVPAGGDKTQESSMKSPRQ